MENRDRVEPGLFHLLLVRVRSRGRRLDLLRSPLTDTKVSRDLVEIDTAIDEALVGLQEANVIIKIDAFPKVEGGESPGVK